MKKRFSFVMAAAVAAMAISACGNSSAPAPAATQAPAAAEAKQEAPAAEVPAGDVWTSGVNVTVDVPAKAGGGTDLYTRYLTAALQETTGANFVVNNYDTSEVGMQTAKNAPADGLTVVTCHGGAIIQYMTGASEVNIKDDMKVVGILNLGGPQAIITNPGAPYTNFAELSEYIKANPGDVTVGCSLGGTTQILFTALMNELTDGQPDLVNYVQCSNEADKLTNVASNAINIANCSVPNALAYDADGKLTLLGTLGPKVATTENMSELLGEKLDPAKFATTLEQGLNTTWDSCYYVLAPAGTPDEVCESINGAICKAVETDAFVEGNKKMATFVKPMNYQETKDALNNEWAFLDELVGSMGLKTR